jgi:hypothetical protein
MILLEAADHARHAAPCPIEHQAGRLGRRQRSHGPDEGGRANGWHMDGNTPDTMTALQHQHLIPTCCLRMPKTQQTIASSWRVARACAN